MLDDLKFVQGAVAKKDFVPCLTHFSIKNGRILGFNGHIAISSPIALNIDVTPKADAFIRAIKACNEGIQITVTPTGKLSIKSGKFRSFIPCISNDEYPEVSPSGTKILVQTQFFEAITTLAPFIAEDASKQWARGLLIRGSKAYATNNVVFCEYDLKEQFPVEINIPAEAVNELVRIGKKPEYLMVDETSITFVYENERWLRSSLYTTGWPDTSKLIPNTELYPFSKEFKSALESLEPFVDKLGSVYFAENELRTSADPDEGSSVELTGAGFEGRFSVTHLLLMLSVASAGNLSFYPRPCPFAGPNIRGVIVGLVL